MSASCDEYQVLITGHLDGELDAAQQEQLEAHLKTCSACRREYEAMKNLVVGTSTCFAIDAPPEEVWDTFLEHVYNRIERKTGWLLLILGLVALTLYGTVLFIREPWAAAGTKLLFAVPVVGLVLLFISVLRQRIRIAQNDRYTKEIHR
jgi:predicted anti-sigma-YlaC factor YlaD